MCGIAGILYFNEQQAEESVVRKMTRCMAHRGPDAESVFTEGPLGLGHLRLSIIDLSTAANQPFADHSGRYVMVFNGEMYNYQEVKAQLPDYPFRTTSDTEVLLAAYIRWGADCIHRFRGMFAFAVWDRQEKSLFLMRDRMGVKPLYYYIDKDRLLFASEIRGILATGMVARKINPAALQEYFSYQSVGSGLTIIKGIEELGAGCYMMMRNGQAGIQQYWDVTKTASSFDYADSEATKKQIHSLLAQSVERRLVSDVPVGAFLSGGIDSSAIVGLMAEVSTASPNTFNVSFSEEEFDESKYASLIAKKFGTRHTTIKMAPETMLEELEHGLNAMDTPSADGINTYVVSKAISKAGMRVALSGTGGDELFAGYPFFLQYLRLHNKKNWYRGTGFLRKVIAAGLTGAISSRRQRLQQIITAPSPAIEYNYPVSRQILPPAFIRKFTGYAGFKMQDTALYKVLLSHNNAIAQYPLLSQVSIADYLGYTQYTLLKDTDQMSMAVSLEVREPFFDHDLVEFMLGVPDEQKYPAYPKCLLVEALSPMLPDEIVHRKKQGFVFPWKNWMKKELRSFCEQRLNNLGRRSFINGKELQAYWQRFLNGDASVRWAELWLFVVLEYWMERNGVEE